MASRSTGIRVVPTKDQERSKPEFAGDYVLKGGSNQSCWSKVDVKIS